MKKIIFANSIHEKTKPHITRVLKNETNQQKEISKGLKRDKLKNLLISKYMKKFGLIEENKILLNNEVSRFLDNEKLNDADLKKLEKRLAILLGKREVNDTHGSRTPLGTHNNLSVSGNDRNSDLPIITNKAVGTNSMIQPTEDDDLLDERKYKKDFVKNGDEWIKIMSYNKKQFENEKVQRFQKEVESKQRNKSHLDFQINEKLAKQQVEDRETAQYFNYMLKDVDNYLKTEKMKKDEMKRKIMQEKEIRDLQLRNEKHRKKVQSQAELVHDRYLLQRQLDIIENEKNNNLAKKAKEKEAYNQIQIANIEFKKTQLEKRKQERESDKKAIEEYSRILDKQEQDRVDYFKKCENRQNDFMTRMAENVVKVSDNKLAKEDEKIQKYQNDRDHQEKQEEERRKKKQQDQKKETKNILDMQINYKKNVNEQDRNENLQMAKFFQQDAKQFENQENEKNKKVN